jgi:hypothetical protein
MAANGLESGPLFTSSLAYLIALYTQMGVQGFSPMLRPMIGRYTAVDTSKIAAILRLERDSSSLVWAANTNQEFA